MKVLTAFTNRLGTRASNQDRCLVVERKDRVLLAVADGMGGHARGELAAQAAIESLQRQFLEQRKAVDEPHQFLERALHIAHLEVIEAGRAQTPQVTPRTTCVACLVQDDQAWWAHVGDSRLYLIRQKRAVTRTRDHSVVEDLLQNGAITEEETRRHPLRNSVTRCLGGASKLPRVSLDHARLKPDDTLLLCSDGLWSSLPEPRLLALPTVGDLETALNRLGDEAEMTSYPSCDNVSLVGLRWLSGTSHADNPATTTTGKPRNDPQNTDPVQQAIDDIHRAMLDYASEMKK